MSFHTSLQNLTTNPNSSFTVETSYLIPLDIIYRPGLEYWWGLNYGELDLTSPMNSVTLRADMMEMLTKEECMLTPTLESLKIIEDFLEVQSQRPVNKRERFLDHLPEQEYEYIFIPVRSQPTLYVYQQDTHSYDRYDSPYDDLPRFTSTAHPCFVAHAMLANQAFATYPPPEPFRRLIRSVNITWAARPPIQFFEVPYETAWVPTSDAASSAASAPSDDSSDDEDDDESHRDIRMRAVRFADALPDVQTKVNEWHESCRPVNNSDVLPDSFKSRVTAGFQ